MKVQKWTVGLAAAGVVSLASVAQAEETKSSLETALSGTTLSGYVDVGFQWNFGSQAAAAPGTSFFGATKANGFNLNVVNLKLEKPLDDSGWAAGYTVELWLGPDAAALGTTSTGGAGASDFAIKQANVVLRAPVGNGIDFKVGVFDTIIGYEVANGPSNPNISRSYGITAEPFQHTGILASYTVVDGVTVNAGLAGQGASSTINGRNGTDAERFAYMASVAVTAPEDAGFLAGSALYAGFVAGEGTAGAPTPATSTEDRVNYYVGGTMATPVAGLSVGAAFDYVVDSAGTAPGSPGDVKVYGLYASFAASEKLSFHGRLEYVDSSNNPLLGTAVGNELFEITATAQYNLWENVLTRIEARYDRANGNQFGGTVVGTPTEDDAWSFLAQVVYKF